MYNDLFTVKNWDLFSFLVYNYIEAESINKKYNFWRYYNMEKKGFVFESLVDSHRFSDGSSPAYRLSLYSGRVQA